MLALIGLIVLICLGVFFVLGFFGASAFGAKSEALGSLAISLLMFWLAFHFSPFSVHWVG